jgi:hypothetical protein
MDFTVDSGGGTWVFMAESTMATDMTGMDIVAVIGMETSSPTTGASTI